MAPILRLTNGTDIISLLRGDGDPGFHLDEWTPGVRVDDTQNVIETFNLKADGGSPNDLIHETQNIRRLLIKAKEYQDGFWRATPVWIEAKADCETNMRYAPVLNGYIPEDDNPYREPFTQQDGSAVMNNLTLLIERGDWLANAPGESQCVETSGLACLSYPSYIKFNATTTGIDCGSNAGIDDLPAGANGFTAEAWIRADGWGENDAGRIFDKRSGGTGWFFGIYNVGGLIAQFDCPVPISVAYSGVDEFSPDSDWHHVVVQFEDTTRVTTLGIDGQEVQSYLQQINGGGAYTGDAAQVLHIGNLTADDRCWDGDIGWTRLSNIERYTFPYTVPERCTLPAIDANTVGQWIGAENGGATIDNQEGNPLWDGTLTNGVFHCDCYCGDPACAVDGPPPPWAITFNGASSEIVIPDNAQIQDIPADEFTAEAWIKADGYGDNNEGRIFDKTASVADGWNFHVDSTHGLVGNVYTDAVDGLSRSGLDEFTADGLWHHVCMEFDGRVLVAPEEIYLWIDGRPVSSYALQQLATGNYDSDIGNDLYIGNRSDGARTFDGDIGWCRISDTTRYPANLSFTPPDRCNLPTIDANTMGQWIGMEAAGATIDNQEGLAAIDGTLTDGVFVDECDCDVPPVGQEATCEEDVYLTNKHTRAQLTNIHTESLANAFSPNLLGTWPYGLIDTVGAAPQQPNTDYVYFGIDTAQANSGPFNGLVFDLSTVISDITVGTWSYSDGGAGWPAFTNVRDNTRDGGNPTVGTSTFDTIDINSVHWDSPSDGAGDPLWMPEAIGALGVTAYWVRVEVTAVGAAPVSPVQGNRNVYALTEPYIEIAAAQVGGDLNALMKYSGKMISEVTGFINAGSVHLYGLRDCARGEDFSAYLNLADEQNPTGVSIVTLNAGAIVEYAHSPTGRALYLTIGAGVAVNPRCYVYIEEGTANQYAGTYHCFVRGKKDFADTPPAISVQMDFKIGGGTAYFHTFHSTETLWFGTQDDSHQFLDMGQVTFPSELMEMDEVKIDVIMGSVDANGGEIWLYDIILLPTDEWAGECNASELSETASRIAWRNYVDSLTDLRRAKTYYTLQHGGDAAGRERYMAENRFITASTPILLGRNTKQRLWAFTYNLTGANDYSGPDAAQRTKLFSNQRYLSMRGAR